LLEEAQPQPQAEPAVIAHEVEPSADARAAEERGKLKAVEVASRAPRPRSDRWDWAVASICISAGVVGLRTVNDPVLWDQFARGGSAQNQVIGTLTKKKGGVRFRPASSPLWHDVPSESEEVSVGDTVFTSDDGQAELKLQDGSVAEIEPNSLIVVQLSSHVLPDEGGWLGGKLGSFFAVSKRESLLKIERGAAKLNLRSDSSPLKIQVKEKVYSLSSKASNGAAKVSVDSLGEKTGAKDGVKFSSLSAEGVELAEIGASGEASEASKVQVGRGQEAVGMEGVAGMSRLKLQAAAVTPELPAPGERLLVPPETPVAFTWRWRGRSDASVLLELQGDNVPSGSEKTQIPGSAQVTRLRLPSGAYRWRLALAEQEGAQDEQARWQSFSVATLVAPRPLGPLAGAWIGTTRGGRSSSVLFSWQPPAAGLQAELEWVKVPESQAEPKPAVAPTPQRVVVEDVSGWQTKLDAGAYEWRVRSRSAEGGQFSAWSDPLRFSVGADEAEKGQSSVILAQAPTVVAPPAPPPVAPPPAPVAPPAPVKVAAPPVVRKPPPPRILAAMTPMTSTQLGNVAQRLDQIVVPLEWQKLKDATYYELTVANDATGKVVLNQKTKQTFFNWKLDSLSTTRFRYEIVAVTRKGERIASAPVPIEIRMTAPVPTSPPRGSKVAPNESNSVLLTWQSTVLTKQYQVQLARDPEFKDVVRDETAYKNLHIFKGLEAPGAYHWRIRATAHGNASTWSSPSQFVWEP
jgi:hypothetical protein